jgi:hypothetical protein
MNLKITKKSKSMSIKIANTDTMISDLKHNGEHFKLTLTTFTKKIECNIGTFRYLSCSEIPLNEMYFIKKVKKHVLNLPQYPVVKNSDISYIKNYITGDNKTFTSQLIEIDLSAAYWSITYQDGYISKEIYEEGLKLSKKIRLVALGALARKLTTIEFDGYSYSPPVTEPLHPSATVFFNACLKTSAIMNNLRALMPDDVFFIWSDAIFFRGYENFKKVSDFLKKRDIKFKSFNIDKLKYKNNIAYIYSEDFAKKHGGKRGLRTFNFKIS